jgi:hypothetical protein
LAGFSISRAWDAPHLALFQMWVCRQMASIGFDSSARTQTFHWEDGHNRRNSLAARIPQFPHFETREMSGIPHLFCATDKTFPVVPHSPFAPAEAIRGMPLDQHDSLKITLLQDAFLDARTTQTLSHHAASPPRAS